MENWRISRIEEELQELTFFGDDPELHKYLSGACFCEGRTLPEDEGFSEERSVIDSSSSASDIPTKIADINLAARDNAETNTSLADNNAISGVNSSVAASITISKHPQDCGPEQACIVEVPNGEFESSSQMEPPRSTTLQSTGMDYAKKNQLLPNLPPNVPSAAIRHITDKYDSPERLNINNRLAVPDKAVTHSASVPVFNHSNWHRTSTGGRHLAAAAPRLSSLRSPNIPRANTGYSLSRLEISQPVVPHNGMNNGRLSPPDQSPDWPAPPDLSPATSTPERNAISATRDQPESRSFDNSPQNFRPTSEVVTEHDILQVEAFYRSHKTEVVPCQCLVEMYTGKARDKPPRESGRDFDLSRWTYCTVGIPVLVLDSGDSRSRLRSLSIILAERGTGFTLWKETVNHLTNYQAVVNNFHSLHTSKDHTKLVGFRFKDNIAASDFFHKYQAFINNPEDDLLNIGHKSKKSRKTDRKNSKKPSARKPIKTDISSPCCFTHITTMDKNFGCLSVQETQNTGV